MRVENEHGEIKCIDEKGNIKWLSKQIVDFSTVLRDYNIKVVDAPEKLEPVITPKEETTTIGASESKVELKEKQQTKTK